MIKMPVINILMFFVTFWIVTLAIIYFLVKYYNKKNLVAIERFVFQASEFKPAVLQNIKLRYWTTNGARTMISPNNQCDIYLFDNFLAIVRRQNFIFKAFFTPVLISSDITSTKNIFRYLTVYKPDRIIFNQVAKGQIDIKVKDPGYNHYKIDITFNELTNEQLTELSKIKNWC
jgi:hypothetical protein